MKKIPKIWLLASIGLLATSASCEKKVITPSETEKIIEVPFGQVEKISFDGKEYQIKIENIIENRCSDCNVIFDNCLTPAGVFIKVNDNAFTGNFSSCKFSDEFNWEKDFEKTGIKISDNIFLKIIKLGPLKIEDFGRKETYLTKIKIHKIK